MESWVRFTGLPVFLPCYAIFFQKNIIPSLMFLYKNYIFDGFKVMESTFIFSIIKKLGTTVLIA